MHDFKAKKRKLHLNRETILPLQRNALGTDVLATVNGGEDKRDTRDRTVESIAYSAASGASVSTVTSGASAGLSGAVSGVTSGVGASIDAASQRLGLPCWTVTTASVISRLTRR
jgi:hypothetical protein